MLIEGYGIKLVRLTEKDIELVRQWRNSTHINRFMEFREQITPEQQKKWFNSINNIHNNYFIIEADEKQIGLINGAQIDWKSLETKSGGIFIWDEDYWRTKIPLAASLLLTDTSVFLGLNKTYAKILRDNSNALSFNKMLGYELLPFQEEKTAQDHVLYMSNYIMQREKLRKLFFNEFEEFVIRITFQKIDDPVELFYINKLRKLDGELTKELELVVKA